MGAVYLVNHLILQKQMALKVVRIGSRQQELAQRALREAQSTVRIDSPHVVKASDAQLSADGTFYLVMEALEGHDLEAELLRGGRVPQRRLMTIALQACEGLRAAHALGIVHRDIKPGNAPLYVAGGSRAFARNAMARAVFVRDLRIRLVDRARRATKPCTGTGPHVGEVHVQSIGSSARLLLVLIGLSCTRCAGEDSLASAREPSELDASATAEPGDVRPASREDAGQRGVDRQPGGSSSAVGASGAGGSSHAGAAAGAGSTAGTGAASRAGSSGASAGASAAGTTGSPDVGSVAAGRVVGYFVAWGVYGRNYHVKNIVDSGAAETLTHINYAFANVTNGACAIGDAYAEYDRFYDAATSVDGQPDSWDAGSLRGSFHQLQKLKAMHPQLRVLISLGGWTWSTGFSAAAAPAQREAFVRSCVELFITDPRWPGLFDGIDVDWEYPARCGNTCSDNPEDTQNFTALLAELRRQLDAVRPGLELTIAAPAAADKIDGIEVDRIHPHLDAINVMTYDL
ncbi:MAG TPA: glycosyl hydrolase family 18 protein, partial [Polyangiales bacterium]|nr:glycosyl hydrolase family 18 protein [Polyangiales bacterium]